MLEGLDQVHWHLLQHSYGSAKDVPELLQKISTTAEKDEFEEYYDELMNRVHHQGDLYNAAPATIPFLIQLLNQKSFKYKASILGSLGGFLNGSRGYLSAPHPRTHGLGERHDCIAIQQIIYANVPLYLSLLADEDSKVRLSAASLLGALSDQRHKIRLPLVRAIQKEQDVITASKMIYNLIGLIPFSYWGSANRIWKHYKLLLAHWVETHPSELVQLNAAIVWVEIHPTHILHAPKGHHVEIPLSIVNSLKKGYIDSKGYRYPPIMAILEKLGFYVLGDMLLDESILIDKLHEVARHMLLQVFDPIRIAISRHSNRDFLHLDTNHFYKTPYERIYAHNRTGWRAYDPATEKLVEVQQFVLNAIIQCDRFWELPTNLFSFFFHLPDDRESLRALVMKNQA